MESYLSTEKMERDSSFDDPNLYFLLQLYHAYER